MATNHSMGLSDGELDKVREQIELVVLPQLDTKDFSTGSTGAFADVRFPIPGTDKKIKVTIQAVVIGSKSR